MGRVKDRPYFRQIRNRRMFFVDTGHSIGASAGEETSFVYVEYLSSGEVHGRPMTEMELRRKGAPL